VATPAEDRVPGEKVKMTVSERSLGAVGAALESWLASRAGTPGPPTVTGVRVPDTGGLSSTSVLFEADWGSSRRSPSSSACRACPASCAARTWSGVTRS
jgi:hypothetical protein